VFEENPPIVSKRYAITTATVIMLVVLRLNIGWHFFSEGVKHYTDPAWTSEGTLRNATGPLASFYQSYLPDFHGMDEWLHSDRNEKPSDAAKGWLGQVESDLENHRQAFAIHYGLNEKQQKQSQAVTANYQARVRSWGNVHSEELANHVHQWRRQHQNRSKAEARDIPFQKERLASGKSTLSAEAAGWRTELVALEKEHERALGKLLTAEQKAAGPVARPRTSIDTVDTTMTYVIMAVGALLLLGLFTRTACVVGALFLLSVVSMQPFWVSEALPTYNQFVEMFALLALATTQVGRWGGLDFFVHHLITGSPKRGTSDVSES
jgi:uncharacterized membrane protein YphA (DoxX/SURF4 family)